MPGIASYYPHGFSNGVSILGQPVLNVQSNNAWWIDSVNGNDGNNGAFNKPFGTLGRAVAMGFPGDTVMAKSGHSETISSSTALTMSVAGMSVIGLGVGSRRPTFTLDTATNTTINVTAAGVGFYNCRFAAGIAAIASAFTLTTANGFTLDSCSFFKTSTFTFLVLVTTDAVSNDADNMTIVNNDWRDTATTVSPFVSMLGSNENCNFSYNYLNLGVQNDVTAGVKVAAGKLATNFVAVGNLISKLDTSNTAGILFGTNGSTNTGILDGNKWVGLVAGTPLFAPALTGLGYGLNYATGVADKSGFVNPAADS